MTFLDSLRCEAVKLGTLRSFMVTVAAAVALALGYCLITAGPPEKLGLSTPETAGVFAMANLSFFAAIAGALIASSEHAGGQLTSSVLAVPRRSRILAAKIVWSAVVSTALGLVLAAFIATVVQFPLGQESAYARGTTGTLLSSLALAALSWTSVGVISTCAALIVRSQTVVLSAMIVLSFGGTPLMMAVPLLQYLPTNAGVLMYIDRANQTSDWLNPPDIGVGAAAATVGAWCLLAVVAAAVVFLRRDVGARQAVSE